WRATGAGAGDPTTDRSWTSTDHVPPGRCDTVRPLRPRRRLHPDRPAATGRINTPGLPRHYQPFNGSGPRSTTRASRRLTGAQPRLDLRRVPPRNILSGSLNEKTDNANEGVLPMILERGKGT